MLKIKQSYWQLSTIVIVFMFTGCLAQKTENVRPDNVVVPQIVKAAACRRFHLAG